MLFIFNKSILANLLNYIDVLKRSHTVGRKKIDRSNKVIQSFEATKPLVDRLKYTAKERGITVSALIRYILEHYFENREL